jgi:hypothetical protein
MNAPSDFSIESYATKTPGVYLIPWASLAANDKALLKYLTAPRADGGCQHKRDIVGYRKYYVTTADIFYIEHRWFRLYLDEEFDGCAATDDGGFLLTEMVAEPVLVLQFTEKHPS